MISQNVFPDDMKYAEVSPIFKKNDKLSKTNFRPVSILTGISKIYESLLNEQLTSYFCNIFHSMLSAFRKGYSCQSTLLRFIEDAKKAIDDKNIFGALFMDLSKAFDCLPHGLLIAKMNAYGLSISSCELVASYLSNRKQRVKIGNSRSPWKCLEKGVPQGSILGPLFFNVFLNDLFLFIEKCILYNFADDNSLSNVAVCKEELLNNLKYDCNVCIEWFTLNSMEANPSKFQFMIISPQQLGTTSIDITENISISSEPVIKALGVLIDNKLTFTEHVAH